MVAARDPSAVVRLAGGWMVDQALLGWDVRVLTEGDAERPMRILGARHHDLERVLNAAPPGRWPSALAVDFDLYASDARVRRLMRTAMDAGSSDCRFWSESAESAGSAACDEAYAVRHRLSAVARAFKTHALAALALPAGEPAPIETFRQAALLDRFDSV